LTGGLQKAKNMGKSHSRSGDFPIHPAVVLSSALGYFAGQTVEGYPKTHDPG